MATKKAKKRPAKKAAAKKKVAGKKKTAAKRPPARKVRPGFISHTELASSDPGATVAWAKKALGWKFGKPMKTPAGPYHMWSFGGNQGGGIRKNNPPEVPGTVPYAEVASIDNAYYKALATGATTMMPPEEIPGGMGWIAIVSAPGGMPIGLWAQKK
jgi:predicted enzyme related to lactoylglutathione lyase